MELDYLLATAIFLSVCVYVAVGMVSLYDVCSGDIVYKKEYLTHYNDLKYNFSISKENLIYNFKINNITYVIDGWVFKNNSDGRALMDELNKLNNSNSFIIAYSPSKNEFIVSKNEEFLKIVGNYNISTTYKRREYYDYDLEIIHPENYTIKHRDFPQTPYTKLFEVPFCIVDRGNITIKYHGILGVGR